MKKALMILVYLMAPVLPILVLVSSNSAKYADPQYFLPMALGCITYTWLCLQVVLAARLKFIDRIFGLDKLYRFHGYMAFVAIVAALMHKQIEEALFGEYFATQIGSMAILTFLIATAVSLAFMTDLIVGRVPVLMRLREKLAQLGATYGRVTLLHSLSVLGVLLMYVHISFAGSFYDSMAVKGIFSLYLVITLGAYAQNKWLLRPESYLVKAVIRETEDVITVKLSPKTPGRLVIQYEPGQFAYVGFPGHAALRRPHPFTLSSCPVMGGDLSFTIKALGPFTRRIETLKEGDEAGVSGPYGRFSYKIRWNQHKASSALVFVAGGIGITPFLSMLRHMASENLDPELPVILLWGARKASDLIAFTELEGLQSRMKHLSLVPVLSMPDSQWSGREGYLDVACLTSVLNEKKLDMAGCDFYVCGPPAMSSLVIKALKSMGVASGHIVSEKFSL